MKCPKCSSEMESIIYQGVEVDRCTSCKGLWFDMLEHENLKSFAGSESIDRGVTALANDRVSNERFACPACNAALIGMVVNGQPHISYEACTVCYGVFFDAGEFTDFKNESFVDTIKALFTKSRT